MMQLGFELYRNDIISPTMNHPIHEHDEKNNNTNNNINNDQHNNKNIGPNLSTTQFTNITTNDNEDTSTITTNINQPFFKPILLFQSPFSILNTIPSLQRINSLTSTIEIEDPILQDQLSSKSFLREKQTNTQYRFLITDDTLRSYDIRHRYKRGVYETVHDVQFINYKNVSLLESTSLQFQKQIIRPLESYHIQHIIRIITHIMILPPLFTILEYIASTIEYYKLQMEKKKFNYISNHYFSSSNQFIESHQCINQWSTRVIHQYSRFKTIDHWKFAVFYSINIICVTIITLCVISWIFFPYITSTFRQREPQIGNVTSEIHENNIDFLADHPIATPAPHKEPIAPYIPYSNYPMHAIKQQLVFSFTSLPYYSIVLLLSSIPPMLLYTLADCGHDAPDWPTWIAQFCIGCLPSVTIVLAIEKFEAIAGK